MLDRMTPLSVTRPAPPWPWNASIVSEAVNWGTQHLSTTGLGAYIAERTVAGDYVHIALGVAVMSFLVLTMNRLLWRPLYAFAERRTRLDEGLFTP